VATSDKRQVRAEEEDKKEAKQMKDEASAKEKTEGGEGDNNDIHKQVHIPTLKRTDSSYLITAACKEGDNEDTHKQVHIPTLKRTDSSYLITAACKEGDNEDTHKQVHIPTLKRTDSPYLITTAAKDCSNDCSDWDQESARPLETEYPKPSSNYQKTQRRLARQKQLDDMRAREAALARSERLKRRRGLLLAAPPSKKSRERRVMWKEESSLVEVFQYSSCPSSRGSTLEPEELD
jgi:hypothetical protein